jgi:hypothetical protein
VQQLGLTAHTCARAVCIKLRTPLLERVYVVVVWVWGWGWEGGNRHNLDYHIRDRVYLYQSVMYISGVCHVFQRSGWLAREVLEVYLVCVCVLRRMESIVLKSKTFGDFVEQSMVFAPRPKRIHAERQQDC